MNFKANVLLLTIIASASGSLQAQAADSKILAIQQSQIAVQKAELASQKMEIERLKRGAMLTLKEANSGNCTVNFSQIANAKSQFVVYAGHYSGLLEQAYSAVFVYTVDVIKRASIRPMLSSDAPGNNNGSIGWTGETLTVATGGVGASCSIAVMRVY